MGLGLPGPLQESMDLFSTLDPTHCSTYRSVELDHDPPWNSSLRARQKENLTCKIGVETAFPIWITNLAYMWCHCYFVFMYSACHCCVWLEMRPDCRWFWLCLWHCDSVIHGCLWCHDCRMMCLCLWCHDCVLPLLCVYGMKFPILIFSTSSFNRVSSAVVQLQRFSESEAKRW